MRDANRDQYERAHAVRAYAVQDHLNPAEAALIERLAGFLEQDAVLDIGIGGGRTTVHLAPRSREYVGVDYSTAMIAACRERFADNPDLAESLQVADARSMPQFADRCFGVVLFLAQGLDSLDHEGRLQALSEMARVCGSGGWVAFSTHNLGAVHHALSVRRRIAELREERSALRLPFALAKRVPERIYEKLANPRVSALRRRDHAFLVESWPSPRVTRLYHVSAREAERQLRSVGLTPVTAFAADGTELGVGETLDASEDLWLHFLARKQ